MTTLNKQVTNLAKLSLLCFSLLLVPVLSYASDASFTWTANAEPVTGYKLYYKIGTDSTPPYDGTGITEGASPIDIGKVTTTTVTGLSPNETYQFTLVAYNDAGDSDYSTPVLVEAIPIPVPTINTMSQN
jgi:hypothetical protein